ncbi:MAG: hypothetical protein GY776_22810 [Alteromonas sp.]|nr:hypothetical protein [Alteromonas sp.]
MGVRIINYKIFSLPTIGDEAQESALNHFLAQHKIIHVDRQIVSLGEQSYWTLCVNYQGQATQHKVASADKKPRIDYKEVLTEAQFSVFAALRELRKELAAKDGVPVFGVFTNDQLAQMVKLPVLTSAQLTAIDGIGESKLSRYGGSFLAVLNNYFGQHHA